MSAHEVDQDWPLVVADDDGIRAAGRPDRCFYCGGQVGQPHGPDCVCVTKRVQLRYSFILDVDVPHGWDEDHILLYRNDSSWCADNALDELEASTGDVDCLCPRFECFLESVVDDTPRRETRGPKDEEAEQPAAFRDALTGESVSLPGVVGEMLDDFREAVEEGEAPALRMLALFNVEAMEVFLSKLDPVTEFRLVAAMERREEALGRLEPNGSRGSTRADPGRNRT